MWESFGKCGDVITNYNKVLKSYNIRLFGTWKIVRIRNGQEHSSSCNK